MFANLTESMPKRLRLGRRLASNTVSLAVHAGFICGAVFLTMKPPVQIQEEKRAADVYIFPEEADEPSRLQNLERLPNITVRTLPAPIEVPIGIPPVDVQTVFVFDDMREYLATDVGNEYGTENSLGDSVGFFPVAAVDEAPVRISSPPLEYPRTMHRAGIEGMVVVKAIVDSTGRVEPSSVEIVRSDNKAFEGAAKRLLNRSLFQPGRVRGRPVRVLIQIPIHFTLVDRGR